MGSYADKLSYEERWQVIHYIRSCEAATKNLDYSETSNTFKLESALTDAMWKTASVAKTPVKTPSVNNVVKEGMKTAAPVKEVMKVEKKK